MTIKTLKWIFVALGAYGIAIASYGGSIFAVLTWLMLHYAQRVYARQDAHPSKAKPVQALTSDALREQECECCRSRF